MRRLANFWCDCRTQQVIGSSVVCIYLPSSHQCINIIRLCWFAVARRIDIRLWLCHRPQRWLCKAARRQPYSTLYRYKLNIHTYVCICVCVHNNWFGQATTALHFGAPVTPTKVARVGRTLPPPTSKLFSLVSASSSGVRRFGKLVAYLFAGS